MKKNVFVILLLILICCFISVKKVNAEIIGGHHGNANLATKDVTSQIIFNQGGNKEKAIYAETEIKKYLSNHGALKWSDEYIDLIMSVIDLNMNENQETFEDSGLGNTEDEIRKNLSEYWKQVPSTQSIAFIPAELALRGVLIYGGSSGNQCYIDNSERCDDMLQFKQHWYPVLLDEVLNIQKNDANGQKIYFNYITEGKDKYEFSRIVDNGNVDSNGTYVSINKLKLSKKEYNDIMNNNGTLNLYISGASPFSMDYFELKTQGVYRPFYIERHAYNKDGIEIALESGLATQYKKYSTIEINKAYIENDTIQGLYIMEQGAPQKMGDGSVKVSLSNPNLDDDINANGADGLAFYYKFKIEIEVIDDAGNTIETNATNNDRDIRDNNAKIIIDDEVVNIENKKSWSEGRIYVSLNDLCKTISCNYEYNQEQEQYKVALYPIEGDNNIVYSMLLSEDNSSFESVLKVYDEVYKFKNKIMDASPYVNDDKIYVPIRFVLEGLGAQVDYYPTNGSQPEEVHIKFDVDTFVETLINNEKIENNIIEVNNSNLEINQYYLQVDGTKRGMEGIQVLTPNNNLEICKTNNDNCDIIINRNKVVFQNPNIQETLKVYIIGKYNDYPYIKSIDLKSLIVTTN